MKAVFVIDIPNDLDVNDLLIDYCVHTKGEYKPIRKGGNHPIKPLPKKAEMTDDWRVADLIETESGRMAKCYFKGRNEVIDEITGETE